jgi:exonuclease III
MNNNRQTKILFWNIRGINSQEKWDAIGDKIKESACHMLCLQETKREAFDAFYIKKLCPITLDKFAFSSSIGASGGLLIVWNSSLFDGTVIQANSYAITIKLICRFDKKSMHITNVYDPSNPA